VVEIFDILSFRSMELEYLYLHLQLHNIQIHIVYGLGESFVWLLTAGPGEATAAIEILTDNGIQ